MDDKVKAQVIKVIQAFDALDPLISVNDEPACTKCRELCHTVDDLWAMVVPEHERHDEFGDKREPVERVYEYTVLIKHDDGSISKETLDGVSDEHAAEEAEAEFGSRPFQVARGQFLYLNKL